MKKKIIVLLCAASTVLSLAACGGKFTCDLCGEEKSGKKHTSEVLGEEVTICDDCYGDIEDLGGALGL